MPRILNGHTVQGVGEWGAIYDDQLVIPGGGTPAFVSPQQIVCQAPVNGADVVATFTPGGPVSTLWGPPGADKVFAGGGTIAASLADQFVRLQNAAGYREIPALEAWDVDPATGTALLVNRQEGATLRVFTKDNGGVTPTAVIPTTALFGARILWHRVIWTEATPQGIRPRAFDLSTLRGIDLAVWPGNIYQALLVTSKVGRLFVIYTLQEGEVVCHPVDDPTRGHYLPGEHFGVDAELQADGSLLVAWCTNRGESAGSRQTIRWSLDALDAIAPSTPALPTIDRAVWTGWFEFNDTPVDPPGTCRFGVGTDGYIRARDGRAIAQYAAALDDSNVDALDAEVEARHTSDPSVPVLAYWTRQAQAIRVPNAPIVGVEAYPKVWESPAQFEERVAEAVERVPRPWLIGCCYSSNTTNWADLTLVIPIYARLLRDHPRIEGLLVFSGNGRQTGYQDHPETQALWRALFNGIPGVPDLGTIVPDPGTTTTPDPEPVHMTSGVEMDCPFILFATRRH